jgi:hypothetical protein
MVGPIGDNEVYSNKGKEKLRHDMRICLENGRAVTKSEQK